jgi:DNA-binding NtrC family response regulator
MIASPPAPSAPDLTDPVNRLRVVLSQIREASTDDGPLVFKGEPGTGKSLLAAITHCWSARADAPFVAVSCALRPESALEAQLFGSPDPAEGHVGQFDAADGGTLMLADIDLAPPRIQQRLATALREHRAGNPSIAAEHAVRPVATTTRDLRALVAEGKFSSELLSQLEGPTIEVPTELLCTDPLFRWQGAPPPVAEPSLDDRLREVEAEIIGSALRATGGNKSRAALLLHIKRTTLTDRIHRLGDRLGPWAHLHDAGDEAEQIA